MYKLSDFSSILLYNTSFILVVWSVSSFKPLADYVEQHFFPLTLETSSNLAIIMKCGYNLCLTVFLTSESTKYEL